MPLRHYYQLDDDQVINSYLMFKYAKFNYPERILLHKKNPEMFNLLGSDVDQFYEYNLSALIFAKLPLKDRLSIILSPIQNFNTDKTMLAYLSQTIFIVTEHVEANFRLKKMLFRNNKDLPTIEDLCNSLQNMPLKSQVIFFHLLDIFYSNPTDPYPFFGNVDIFMNRIQKIKESFVDRVYIFLLESNSPAYAFYCAFLSSWKTEQEYPGGIKICVSVCEDDEDTDEVAGDDADDQGIGTEIEDDDDDEEDQGLGIEI